MDALSLLAGDARTFRTEVWASRVHAHRTDPSALTGLLSLEDVDRLVTGSGIRTPALRIVRDGEVLPAASYTRQATLAGQPVTGLVDGRKALSLFGDGATIVLQGLHRYWPPLAELTRSLELELGHPCQVNAYLTPPDAQGFAKHADTHDVFVFQTAGHKLWRIGPDDDELELDLVPGMSAYLPTGTLHAARSESTTSLHVTVGINRTTWRDLLSRASSTVLADAGFDEPLPAGYLAEPELLEKVLTDRLAAFRQRVAELRRGDPHRAARGALPHQSAVVAGRRAHRSRADHRGGCDHHPLSTGTGPLRRGGERTAPGAAGRPRAADAAAAGGCPGARPGRRHPAAGRPARPHRGRCGGAGPPARPRGSARDRPVTDRCSAASQARGESQIGTASRVDTFVLLECPGPWGREALRDSRLPEAVKRRLRALDGSGTKVLLIRREEPVEAGTRLFVCRDGRTRTALLDDPGDLLDLSIPADLAEHPDPLYLVCTHGRHDVCCAERGRPLWKAAHAVAPEHTWQLAPGG